MTDSIDTNLGVTVPTEDNTNTLLKINTIFSSYLAARTRSYKEHLVNGGSLDYAYDADFAMRQKINSIAGWNKLYRTIVTQDIPIEIKWLFSKASAVGSMKFPEVYEISKACAERLEMPLPVIYVKETVDRPEIFSYAGEGVMEPCISLSKGLVKCATKEELRFLIGCEFGRIQNNHCAYSMAYRYLGEENLENMDYNNLGEEISSQLIYTYGQWLKVCEITIDRAGIMCSDIPERYSEIINGIHKKGVVNFYGAPKDELDIHQLTEHHKVLHTTPARNIMISPRYSDNDKRIFAGMEFISCETLYNWREDLKSDDIHTISKQILEVRCDMIMGAAKEGV